MPIYIIGLHINQISPHIFFVLLLKIIMYNNNYYYSNLFFVNSRDAHAVVDMRTDTCAAIGLVPQ